MDEVANKPKGFFNGLKAWWLREQFMCVPPLPHAASPLPALPAHPSLFYPLTRPSPPSTSRVIVLFFLFIALLTVYHFLSDGDFSVLMTLGSLLVLFGFGLLVAKLAITRKLTNVSFKTLQAYALVFSARLCSILFYEGYLPFDRSGDWFYQTVEAAALVLTLGLIGGAWAFRLKASGDKFDAKLMEKLGLPSEAGVLLLVAPAAVLAAIFHPSLNNNWLTDVAWTFALYLEAVAIWPQLYIFAKEDPVKEIEPLELNFVFSLAGASREGKTKKYREGGGCCCAAMCAARVCFCDLCAPPLSPRPPLFRTPSQWHACFTLFFG